MSEWEWLQEAFNGSKEQKKLNDNVWETMVKPVPCFKEWEHPKDRNLINEGA